VRIGPYTLIAELGRGGMGVVYRARGPDGRDVALKALNKVNAERARRFERERRLLGSFAAEEGFVPLLDAGSGDLGPYIVMPLVPGGTLRHRLLGGVLGINETVELARTVALALGRAHARGIVHRDLKPENILFTGDGKPLVSDLGLAKHFDRLAPGASQSVSLSARGVMRGTAGYMAPEQMQDSKDVGPAADVFALGAIIHECLTGEPAFGGDNLIEVLQRVVSGVAPPIRRDGVSRDLRAIVTKALAVEIVERFADGASVAAALARGSVYSTEKMDAPGTSFFRAPSPDHPGSESESLTPVKGSAETRSRGISPLVAVGLAIAAFVAGGATLWVARAPSAGPASTGTPPANAHSGTVVERGGKNALSWRQSGSDRALQGDVDGAISDYSTALELDPDDVAARAGRARARAAKGDTEGAISDLERVRASAGHRDEPWVQEKLATLLLTRADRRRDEKNYEAAIADYTSVIEIDARSARAWSNRGWTRAVAGDLDGGIADATRALELDPTDAATWNNRAYARGRNGNIAEEIADETKAVELDPKLVAAWYARGVARATTGDTAGTIADETKVIDLDARRADAWTTRGWARGLQGDTEGEIADETKAIELAPDLGRAWQLRGFARAKKGEVDGALADETKAIELDPQLVEAWHYRGVLRAKKGELDGAIADETKAIELDGSWPETWLSRGYTRATKGEVSAAIADLEQFIALAPNDSRVAGAREQIAELKARQ
jgi:serine/threonine protein kinase/tetratricopeptide (TPR) repeat protein